MKQKTREVVIRIPKTWAMRQLQVKATKEFYILKTYKRTRLILAILIDLVVIVPAFQMYGNVLTNNWPALALLAGLCFVLNLGMDDFLIRQCNIIIDENQLEITDKWKSGSFEKLTKELEDYVLKDMSEKQINDYILYNMSMDANDFICYALVFERGEK